MEWYWFKYPECPKFRKFRLHFAPHCWSITRWLEAKPLKSPRRTTWPLRGSISPVSYPFTHKLKQRQNVIKVKPCSLDLLSRTFCLFLIDKANTNFHQQMDRWFTLGSEEPTILAFTGPVSRLMASSWWMTWPSAYQTWKTRKAI